MIGSTCTGRACRPRPPGEGVAGAGPLSCARGREASAALSRRRPSAINCANEPSCGKKQKKSGKGRGGLSKSGN